MKWFIGTSIFEYGAPGLLGYGAVALLKGYGAVVLLKVFGIVGLLIGYSLEWFWNDGVGLFCLWMFLFVSRNWIINLFFGTSSILIRWFTFKRK